MTTITTDIQSSAGLRARLARYGRALVAAMDRHVEARSHARELQRLAMMSDAELRMIGLRREDIVFHVFGARAGL